MTNQKAPSALKLGIDVLCEQHIADLKTQRVALLSHAAAVNAQRESTLRVLWQHPLVNLVKLFAPEHGFYGTAQDMEGVRNENDPSTGLPIISLYGNSLETLSPKEKDLADIDVLVCDLQDIGSRYYTFIYSIALCLTVCAKLKKQIVVLDRPNPLNGVAIEGNILDPAFSSFVGLYPLPVRHGMTVGEMTNYVNKTQGIDCDLTVIPMQGWERILYWDETGLDFIPPSPNMPTLGTALVYPGMCLIESTHVSEGRGTTKPFEWIGAPYMHAQRLADELTEQQLPGVFFRPIHFTPCFQKWAREECHGVQIHVTDRHTFKSYLTGLTVLATIIKKYPFNFAWREKPYEFVTDRPAIDLLTGGCDFRELVTNKKPTGGFLQTFEADEKKFAKLRQEYLLY